MKWQQNHLYTHRAMIDVCFKVHNGWINVRGDAKLYVTWHLKRNGMEIGEGEWIRVEAPAMRHYSQLY